MKYAQIIINISHEQVDRPFTYLIPDWMQSDIRVGLPVMVPFGQGNKERLGYVVGMTDSVDYDPLKIKEISSFAPKQKGVGEKSIELAAWMKEHYGSTMIASLKTVMPVKKAVKKRKNRAVEVSDDEKSSLETNELMSTKLTLSDEQQTIIDSVLHDYDNHNLKTYLVHGITGSGKTEVYMGIIAGMMQRDKESILLVPEIALTYQNVSRFKARFGENIAVLHSKLSAGEKSELWDKASKGEIKVVIGPRSALFVPFNNLGAIVIDEEHEGSYKSEPVPKYHAREVAEIVARLNEAVLVLGSATPSLESFNKAMNGEYELFTLTKRLTGGELPQVYITDLREELRQGNTSIFSERLQKLIEDRLEKKQQIMLFINRRGFSGFISCRACGKAIRCPHCDVTLTEHANGTMVCHYCGHTSARPAACPSCGSKYIGRFKAGTEAVERSINLMFPKAKVLRMDADTTTRKGDFERILNNFSKKKADILVGTQMIVKGHDFPNVTLVGILAADTSLNSSDYRSAERTFQLITQAAGRAGRGELPGEVVIQTYQPDHHAIVHGATQNYTDFFEEEMVYRDVMGYPPVAKLVAVLLQSKDEKLCIQVAATIGKRAGDYIAFKKQKIEDRYNGTYTIGPSAATIAKINDVYRQIFYIKSGSEQALIEIKDDLERYIEAKGFAGVSVQFDFNPMNGY